MDQQTLSTNLRSVIDAAHPPKEVYQQTPDVRKRLSFRNTQEMSNSLSASRSAREVFQLQSAANEHAKYMDTYALSQSSAAQARWVQELWITQVRQRSSVVFEKAMSFCDLWIPMLRPDSYPRHAWNAVFFILISYTAVVPPLQVAFEDLFGGRTGYGSALWMTIDTVVDVLLLLDLLINFRTAFVQDGMLVRSSSEVMLRYVQGNFLLDLLAVFPWSWVLLGSKAFGGSSGGLYGDPDDDGVMRSVLRLLRLIRPALSLFRDFKSAHTLVSPPALLKRFNPAVFRVLRSLLILVCTCHWLGCVWWFFSAIEQRRGIVTSWQPPTSLLNATNDTPLRYSHAFLWGASMMSGLMLYEVRPDTFVETIFTTIAAFLGLCMSVFIISSSTVAISSLDAKEEPARQKLERFTEYLRLKQVCISRS